MDVFGSESKGTQVGTDDLQFVACLELVVEGAGGDSVFITGFYLCHDLPLPDVAGIFCVLTGISVIEAGGVDAVGYMVHLVPPHGVQRDAGGGGVNGVAVGSGDDDGV